MLRRLDLLLGPGLSALRRLTDRGDEIVLVGANFPAHKALPVTAAPGRLLRGNPPPKKGVIRTDGVAR
jgi:L-fucose mutarotase/ribose pyranase (RbsD/FucU family)